MRPPPAAIRAPPCLRVLSASIRAMRTALPSGAGPARAARRDAPRAVRCPGRPARCPRLPQAGQARGHALGEAAVVAAQRAVDLVEDPEGAAVRAFALPAAVAAGQHRRVAAPVQEHHALFAARDPLADGVEQRARQHGLAAAAGSCRPAAPRAARRRRPARASPAAGSCRRHPRPRPAGCGASFRARAWPSRGSPWRLRGGRARPPGRGPSSARPPAACSWGRAPRRPRSGAGAGIEANTAIRVPSTMRAAPPCAASQLASRWGLVMPLCRETTASAPKRALKRASSCGVEVDLRHHHQRLRRRLAGQQASPRPCR